MEPVRGWKVVLVYRQRVMIFPKKRKAASERRTAASRSRSGDSDPWKRSEFMVERVSISVADRASEQVGLFAGMRFLEPIQISIIAATFHVALAER